MIPKAERKVIKEKVQNRIDQEDDQGARSLYKKNANNSNNLNTIRIKKKKDISNSQKRQTASKSVNPYLASEAKKEQKP